MLRWGVDPYEHTVAAPSTDCLPRGAGTKHPWTQPKWQAETKLGREHLHLQRATKQQQCVAFCRLGTVAPMPSSRVHTSQWPGLNSMPLHPDVDAHLGHRLQDLGPIFSQPREYQQLDKTSLLQDALACTELPTDARRLTSVLGFTLESKRALFATRWDVCG